MPSKVKKIKKKPTFRLGKGAYLLPAWLLLFGVVVVPTALGFWISLQDASLTQATSNFVGLDNYASTLSNPIFWQSLWVTVEISVLTLVIQLPIGFGIAVLLNKELSGTPLFRSSLLLPMMLTPVAVGLMWRLMLNVDNGVIAGTLEMLNMSPINWLGDKNLALLSVVLVDSWQNIPFVMLLMLAGLQALPHSPIEAAQVDGANTFQMYRHVIIPLLAPVALVVVMIRIVESIKLFDIIYILTSGGPGTATQNISLLDFRFGFTYMQTSAAAALGVIILIGLSPVYFLWRKANRT